MLHPPASARSLKRKMRHDESAKSKRVDRMNLGVEEETISKIPHCEVLYAISCEDEDNDHDSSHERIIFRDRPVDTKKAGAESFHLHCRSPVHGIQDFMIAEEDDIGFVVIRTVQCSRHAVVRLENGGLLDWTESVYAKSSDIKTALANVATFKYHNDFESLEPDAYEQNRIIHAQRFFFHHRDPLNKYARAHPDKAAHIDALLAYIHFRHGSLFEEADRSFKHGLVSPQCLGLMFRPFEIIVASSEGTVEAFMATDVPDALYVGSRLHCWSYRHDGAGFARSSTSRTISGLRSSNTRIQDLSVYPLRFACEQVQTTLRVRGERMWSLRRPSYIGYKGRCAKGDQFFPEARFMVDYNTYRKMHEHSLAFAFDNALRKDARDTLPDRLDVDDTPVEACMMVMPPDFYGFDFNEKRWIQLLVDNVCDIEWNKAAYKRLVLPEATKDMVQALVAVRKTQRGVKHGLGLSGKRTDITSGKGNGLIMLLHGAPGTGKTLTAESVAEIAEMPLYRVTCGDIGTSAEDVETYLNTVLQLGKIWNCILLLDEADVFLEERESTDLTRNSLVSVFLRVLEYYDGILLLTSNRVGVLDEAFKSRIQVALHYERLDRSARWKIWQNFIEMLEEDQENVDFAELRFHVSDLADRAMNGRQIRNILTTARQLAIYKDERLEWRHLKQALDVSENFDKYLTRVQGHTDDEKARDDRLRA